MVTTTPNPPLTPCVFLRGAGAGIEQWDLMCEAVQAAGWHAVKDRAGAWYLARGGATMCFVDFTDPDQVQVALLKAKFQDLETGRRKILPAITGGWYDADRAIQPAVAVEQLAILLDAVQRRDIPGGQSVDIAPDVSGESITPAATPRNAPIAAPGKAHVAFSDGGK